LIGFWSAVSLNISITLPITSATARNKMTLASEWVNPSLFTISLKFLIKTPFIVEI